MKEYTENKDFKEYVDRYARDHKISVAEALHHKLVQAVKEDYRERRRDKE